MGLSSWIHNLLASFRAKVRTGRSAREDFVQLFLTRLEDRRVLNADFSLTGGELLLDNFTQMSDENLTIQDTGTQYQFLLSEGNWVDPSGMGVTGITAAAGTLTVDKALITNGIQIDGSAIGVDIAFGTGTETIDFSGLTVDIDGAGDISQGVGSTLLVATFDANAGSVTLNETTNDFDTLILNVGADAVVQDMDEVNLGTVSTVGSFSLTAGGAIGEAVTPGVITTGGNLQLIAGGDIGAAGAGALDVQVGGTASLSALGSDIFLSSDQDLTIDHLETTANQADTIDIRTTGAANLTLQVTAAEFVNLETDNITLATQDGKLTIQDETLSAGSITLSNTGTGSVVLGTNLQTDGGNIDLQNAANVTLAASVTLDTELGDDNDAGDVLFSTAAGASINATTSGTEALMIDTTTGAANIDGNVTLSDIGTGVRLGLLSIIAGDGTITLHDTAGTAGTAEILTDGGSITFGSFTQLTGNTSLSTLGGDVNWQNTTVFSDPAGPHNLTIDTDGGNVQLGRFSDTDGVVSGTLVNDLAVDTTSAVPGGLTLHGDITLANNLAFTGGTATFLNAAGSALGIDASITTQGTGTVQILANTGTSDVVMQDGTTITTTDGNVTIDATGNVELSRIVAGGTNTADITAGGAITDANPSSEGAGNENIVASNITLQAANGIGSGTGGLGEGADIDIDGVTLSATNTTAGAVQFFAVNDIALGQVVNTGRAVVIEAGGAITDADTANEGVGNENIIAGNIILQAVNGIGSGTGVLGEGEDIDIDGVTLSATNTTAGAVQIFDVNDIALGQVVNTGRAVVIEAGGAITDADTASEGMGNENIIASSIVLQAVSGIGNGSGLLGEGEDIDINGATLFANNSASGAIQIFETDDIAIQQIINAGRTVILDAGGGITDADPADDAVANITAGGAALRAETGIGSGVAGDLTDIDTAVDTLAAQTTTGEINIAEADTLAIGTVGGLIGLTIGMGGNDDHITVASAGDLTIASPVQNGTGDINLSAGVANLVINADVLTAAPGNIALTGQNVTVATATVEITGAGTITTTDPRNGPVTGTGILTIVAPGLTTLNGATLRTGGGVIQFTTDDIEILGGSLVDAGAGAVMIRNATGGLDITLGAVQAGTLSLTDAELDSIQGDSLRIGRLDLDNAANSAGDITVAGALSAAPALLSKLLLFAGGNVLQTGGGLSAQAIGIEVGGSVTLDGNNDAIQSLSVLAGGGILFNDINALTVGQIADTVDNALPADGEAGIVGVVSSNGFVDLRAQGGDLTVLDLGSGPEISAGGIDGANLAVNLLAAQSEAFIQINAGADVNSTAGTQRYTADNMEILGTLTADDQAVNLRNANANAMIDLGAVGDAAANTLELSDAELDNITAGLLAVGSSTGNLGITVTAPINPAGTNMLHLITPGTVDDAAGSGAIVIENLLVEAGAGASLGLGNHDVNTFAAVIANAGADLAFRDINTLIVGTVNGLNASNLITPVSGITTNGGDVSLTTVAGELRVNQDITTTPLLDGLGGNITLTANAGNVNINTGNLTATGTGNFDGGNIALDANGASSDVLISGDILTNDIDDGTVRGSIAVTADDSVTLIGNLTTTGQGTVTVTANNSNGDGDSDGLLTMAPGSTINAQNGAVTLESVADLVDAGSISVQQITTTGGNIRIDANGLGADVLVQNTIQTANGNVDILADDSVTFAATGMVLVSGTGNVLVRGNEDNANGPGNDEIRMADGSVINAGTGTVTLRTDGAGGGDITLGQVITQNATLAAVTINSGGGVLDGGDTGGADIIANQSGSRVNIAAVTGIGVGGNGPIETSAVRFHVANAGPADVNIDNTTVDLAVVVDQIATLGGNIVFNNNSGTGLLTITDQGVTSGDPGTNINGGNIAINTTADLLVEALLSSRDGKGGSFTLTGGAAFESGAAIQLGTGNITLTTGELDIRINTTLIVDNGPSTFQAPRDIIVGDDMAMAGELISRVDDGTGTDTFVDATAVSVPGPIDSHITLTADFDGDGSGGVLVQSISQVTASGNLILEGSDLFNDGLLDTMLGAGIQNGVHIEADLLDQDQLLAAGDLTLRNRAGVIPTADIVIAGRLGTKLPMGSTGTPNVLIDANENIHLAGDTVVFSEGNVVFGDPVIDDLNAGTSSALNVVSDDTTTFQGRVGDIVGVSNAAERIDSLQTDAGGQTILMGGFVTTTNDQTYGDNVFVHAPTVGSTTFTTTNLGDVDFGGFVAGLGSDDIILNVTGTTRFFGPVGIDPSAPNPTQWIGDGIGPAITVLSTGETFFINGVLTNSGFFQSELAGRITFQEDVNVIAGDTISQFLADVTLDSMVFRSSLDVIFGTATPNEDELFIFVSSMIDTSTGGANITINSQVIDPIEGMGIVNQDLVLSLGAGNLTIVGDVGTAGNRFGDLLIASAGNADLNGQFIISETLTQLDGTGTTTLNGTIDTSMPTGVTLASGNFIFNGSIQTNGGWILTQARENITYADMSSITTLGGQVVSDALGNIMMAENSSGAATIDAAGGPVVLRAGGNLAVSRIVSPGGFVALTATNGAILDSGDAFALSDVEAAQLRLAAGNGVAAPTMGNAVLETQVSNLEAIVGAGGLFVSNTGTLVVGGVVPVPVATLRNNLATGVDVSPLNGITSGGGDVFIETLGPTANLQIAELVSAAAAGNITLLSGNDFLLDNGLQTASGQINVVAENNVIFQPNTGAFVQSGATRFLQATPRVDNIITPPIGIDSIARLTFDLGLPGEFGFVVIIDWGDQDVANSVDIFMNQPAGQRTYTHTYTNPPDANNPGANIRVFLVTMTGPNIHFFGDNIPDPLVTPNPPLPNQRGTIRNGFVSSPPVDFVVPTPSGQFLSVDELVNLAISFRDLGLTTDIPVFQVPTPNFGGVSVIETRELPPFFLPAASVQAPPEQDNNFDIEAEDVDTSGSDAEDEGEGEVQVRLRVLSPAGQVLFEYDIEARYLSNPQPLWNRLTDGRYQIVIVEPGSTVPIVVRDVQLRDHQVIRRFDRSQRTFDEETSQDENSSDQLQPVSWDVPELPLSGDTGEPPASSPAEDFHPDRLWENWNRPPAAGRFIVPVSSERPEEPGGAEAVLAGAAAGGLALKAMKSRSPQEADSRMLGFSSRVLSPAARLRRRLRK